MRKGFVRVRNAEHYAVEFADQVWRTELSADHIYLCNFRRAKLLKAGPTVASTFRECMIPVEAETDTLAASGLRLKMTKYRTR